jgi:RNA polymerase sigma-70 factor (ECF subfamily)
MATSDAFDTLRPRLFSIAYRMLGSVGDAEDVVQDAFLRQQRALSDGARIDAPEAYLATVVTRLSIDQLRSARVRRETYVGEWFPEPVLTDAAGPVDPAAHAEQSDSLSLAFLVLLEQLSPVERAVFLLHDVFGYDFREIAGIVGRSEASCRQHASRARRHIDQGRPRFDASPVERDELAERFFAAVSEGDVDGLVALLADDAEVRGDAGDMSPRWPRPIVGRERAARLLAGLGQQMAAVRLRLELHEVNGQPGALVLDPEGRVVNVFALDVCDGAVRTVRSIINHDKLRHLGPLADIPALMQEWKERER